jgi:hypothetical protein
MGPGFDQRKFLTAQYMRSVTALNWGTSYISNIQAKTLQQQIQDLDFLPNIDTIQCWASDFWYELLATRNIRRVCSPAFGAIAALNRNPNKKLITHLIMNGHYLSQFFSDNAITDQFRNLQHVGVLGLWYGSYTVSGHSDPPTREEAVSTVI